MEASFCLWRGIYLVLRVRIWLMDIARFVLGIACGFRGRTSGYSPRCFQLGVHGIFGLLIVLMRFCLT